jgi:hypothetical protein
MNIVGGQSKYNYRSGTYTTIKFMLLQSKSASRLRIDLIVKLQQTGFGNYIQKKNVPTVNNILPTINYTCWQKKGLDGGTMKTMNGLE